jgi:4-amino-4-deoxy-L-arabinose transferase-like glycosyltransferase
VAAYVLIGLNSLTRYPLVWMDEPWYTQPAWSFATTGRFGEPMFADYANLGAENLVYGRIYLFAAAVSMHFLGPDVMGARLPSFLAGLALIGLTFGLARELWDARTGAIAAVIVATTAAFVRQSHDARPEIMLAGFLVGSLWLLIYAGRTHADWAYVGAGVAGALAADIHLNGLLVPFVLVLVAVVQGSVRRLFSKETLLLLSGMAVGNLWIVVAHVLPNPEAFLDQARSFGAPPPILSAWPNVPAIFVSESARFAGLAPSDALVALLGFVAAIVVVRVAGDRGARVLTTVLLATFVLMAVLVANKTGRYAVLLVPVEAILIARLLQLVRTRLAGPVFVGLTALGLLTISSESGYIGPSDYGGYVAQLQRAVPPHAKVVAIPTDWFGLTDRDMVATHYFGTTDDFGAAIDRLGIEYIVVDDFLLMNQLELERSLDSTQVHGFLNERCVLVAEFSDAFYGSSDGGTPPYTTSIYKVLASPASGEHEATR